MTSAVAVWGAAGPRTGWAARVAEPTARPSPTDRVQMPTDATDAELALAAQRNPAAFDTLYRRYVAAVYRYTLARVGSAEDAEDVTAGVFLDALAGLPAYREQGRFPAWLFTIARRHVLAHRRSHARYATVDAADIPAPHAPPAERLDEMARALEALTEDRREALTLRFFAGLKVSEVAAVMGRGESATKMLIHRGLAQLRDALSADADA